ncbi:hypothetical protein BH10ACT2_BH10ACT2_03240 [soil metagenome]
MRPALTLIIPTGKPPPGAWSTAEAVRDQALEYDAEVLVASGNEVATPVPGAPCRVLHLPGADVFELRAAAIVETRGEIMVILEDHNYPSDDFCARVLAAFEANPEADGVVGTATNGALGLLDRASFLLTWAPFLAPMPEVSPHRCPPPGVVAFRRSVLPQGVPPPGWLEYEMVVELRRKGRLIADDRIQINHIQHLGLGAFPIQFHAGRGFGGMTHEPHASISKPRRLRQAAALPALLVRQTLEGLRRGGTKESLGCMAAVGALAASNAVGQMVGVLFGPGNSPSHLE